MTRNNLDLLRAIAVATVLTDHIAINMHHQYVGPWDLGSLGVFGVYLFFVHTCLVLMWSLERRPHTLDFYVRRAFRIFPLAMLAVIVLALFHVPLFPAEELTAKNFLANLFLVQDLVHGATYMLGVLWSLPLEVDMYLFLPMLFVFARRERTFWPFVLFWLFGAGVATGRYGKHMGNDIFTVLPHFVPGVIAYLGFKRFRALLPAWSFPLFLSLTALGYLCFPRVQTGWLLCLALGFALPLFRDLQQPLAVRVCHTVAKYSYGIYLLHPFALLISFYYLRRLALAWRLSALFALIALFSVVAFHLVEQPLIHVGSRVANRLQRRFGTSTREEFGLDLV